MKKLKIVINQNAIQDLEGIWYYTFQNWSVEQADKYHSLIKEIDFLAENQSLEKIMIISEMDTDHGKLNPISYFIDFLQLKSKL